MKILYVVLICYSCLFQNGKTSKVSLEAFPKEVVENITTSVSMICRVEDNAQTRSSSSPTDVRHISSIYIVRGGDDVASITSFDPPTALVDVGNLDVKGSLSALSGEGSLELSLTDPSQMTLGHFTCTVNGIDGRGHVVVLNSNLTMTSVKPSITDQMDYINAKISNLQQEHQNQAQEIQNQAQEIQNQAQEIQNQAQEIQNQHQENQQQAQEIQALRYRMDNCSRPVAFQALLYGPKIIAAGKTVVFDQTLLNEGNAYDNTTGVFTCALPGIYAFNVHAQSGGPGGSYHEVVLRMKMNNDVVSSLEARVAHDNYDASSMSTVLQLQAGDVVKVVTGTRSYLTNIYSNSYPENLFNGHIVQPDGCNP